MISAAQWDAYNKACLTVTAQAKADVSARVSAWLAANPSATVAEAREAAEGIAAAVLADNAQAASSLAAQWYDARAKAAGAKLDRAVTLPVSDEARESLAKTARYQAGRLGEDGGAGAFAEAMGEWAEYQSRLVLNRTIISNAKRDRRRGVRFARVTTGRNTCNFCTMLAGRGAVYHSRETAGELGKYHTHCQCKVVPSFAGKADDVLVEGHDPKDEERRWHLFEAIDEAAPDASAAKAAKQAANELGALDMGELLDGLTDEQLEQLGLDPDKS